LNSAPPLGEYLTGSYNEPREFKHREDAVKFILGPHKKLIDEIDLGVSNRFAGVLSVKERRQALSWVAHHVEEKQREKGRTLSHDEVQEIIKRRMKEALQSVYGGNDLDFSRFEGK